MGLTVILGGLFLFQRLPSVVNWSHLLSNINREMEFAQEDCSEDGDDGGCESGLVSTMLLSSIYPKQTILWRANSKKAMQKMAWVEGQLWKYERDVKCAGGVGGKTQLSFHCRSNFRETGINAHNSPTFNAPLESKMRGALNINKGDWYLQSRFQSHFVYLADYTFKTQSRVSFINREDVMNQRQRHYWQNTNLCRKISRWTHFSFQIKCCKAKQSIEIFLLYVKLLIWLISLHWNECFLFH